MRILLTGASGFVGSQALASLVAAQADAHAVSRQRPPVDGAFEWHQADLLAPGAAQGLVSEIRPDCILHLAWCVEHGKFWTDPANLDWVAATLALARAAADTGVRRFVGTGTCYEYDWPAEGPCDEYATPLAPHMLYDVSKDSCRRVLAAFFEGRQVAFSWARLFFLYGPGEAQGRLVSSIARALLAGEPALCSAGLAERDFMDVRDAGAALAALAMSEVQGIVNIGTGAASRVADIAQQLGRLAGRPELVKLGALPDRPGEPPRIVARTERLHGEVGFIGGRSLEQGLDEALSFWRTAARGGVKK